MSREPACCTFELTFQVSTLHFLLISDPTDPRLSDFRNVPDPELLQRRGIFVAEGRLVVRRLLTERPIRDPVGDGDRTAHAALADVLGARPDLPVYVVSPAVMKEISGFNIHRGCLAIGERPHPMAVAAGVAGARTVVLLERVANADNIGGIFRNAAAFGAGAVLLDEAVGRPAVPQGDPHVDGRSARRAVRPRGERGFGTSGAAAGADSPPSR